MKMRTRIKSTLSVAFSNNFTGAYKKFTLKHVKEKRGMPETVLKKPLPECKAALLSTAGVHLKHDVPFEVDSPGGDHTIRMIPSDVTEEELTVTHLYYDKKSAQIDPSIVFPITQLKEVKEQGKIGSIADTNIGLNGGILETELVEKESIPQVVQLFQEENIDIALLVPG